MLIGYARVSTDDQKLDLQLDALAKAGVEADQVYRDKLSGARSDRPELEHAIKALRPGDTLVVWRLDRLGRNLKDLIEMIERIEKTGAGFRSLSEAMDTTTPGGRLIFHMMGALAEFERNLIRERTVAGLKAARLRGKVGGRPKKLDAKKLRAAVHLLTKTEMPVAEICEQIGVSVTTLYRRIPGGKAAVLERRGDLDPERLLAEAGIAA